MHDEDNALITLNSILDALASGRILQAPAVGSVRDAERGGGPNGQGARILSRRIGCGGRLYGPR